MNKITFKRKDYPVREFIVKETESGNPKRIIVAHDSLSNAIEEIVGEDFDYSQDPSDECWEMDQKIYYYLSDEEFNLPAAEICKDFLDIELIFVRED